MKSGWCGMKQGNNYDESYYESNDSIFHFVVDFRYNDLRRKVQECNDQSYKIKVTNENIISRDIESIIEFTKEIDQIQFLKSIIDDLFMAIG